MFEYLMPLLFTRTLRQLAARSRLPRGGRAADRVRAREGAFPGAFPNPPTARSMRIRFINTGLRRSRLALKPGLEDDLVVAPYATMLALLVDPGSRDRQSEAARRLRAARSDGVLRIHRFQPRKHAGTASAASSSTPTWRITRA